MGWWIDNWHSLFESVGIIGGLLFTAASFRSEAKTRRIANLLTITSNHRAIWAETYVHVGLGRVKSRNVDLQRKPVTPQEEIFVNSVVLHVSSTLHATLDDLMIREDGFRGDVSEFFSLPIPHAVWRKVRVYQNDATVRFIDTCIGIDKKDTGVQ